MTVALYHFPTNVLRAAQWSWEITSQLITSGQTASGVTPAMRVDGGGAWKATLSDFNIRAADARRSWRSFSAIADGGVNPIVIPFHCSADIPWPTVNGVLLRSYPDVLHAGDVPFSTDVGYSAGVIDAVFSEAALLNATSAKIAITYGGALQGGEHFSLDHVGLRHRLHRIRTVKDNGDGTWNVTFRPGLRADVAAGMKVEFDHPKCVMRLAAGNAMDMTLETIGIGKPSVSFMEAFPPFPIPA